MQKVGWIRGESHRNRCDIAPKGRFHAVTLLLLTSFSKPGAVPIHAYVKDDTSPS